MTAANLSVAAGPRMGKEPEAARLARQYLDEGTYDFDLVNVAYVLGMRNRDYDMAIKSLEFRNKTWPNLQVDTFIKLGALYAGPKRDPVKALASFKAALDAAPAGEQAAVRKLIPPAYLARL